MSTKKQQGALRAPEGMEQPILVRATADGHDNVAVRQPGDEFYMPQAAVEIALSRPGCWFEPVEAADEGSDRS